MSKLRKYPDQLTLLLLLFIYFAWWAWPIAWSGSANLRLVQAFDPDEGEILELILGALDSHSFEIGYEYYGYLYFNICLIILKGMQLFAPLTDQLVIIVMRLVTAFFGLGTVFMTYKLARDFLGQITANLAALLLAFVPLLFLTYSVMAYPDIPQLLFLVMGLYACCRYMRDKKQGWMIAASLAAGFAFACKYGGVFLLPVIAGTGIALAIREHTDESPSPGSIKGRVSVILMLSVVTAIFANPELIRPYLSGKFIVRNTETPALFTSLNILRYISIPVALWMVVLLILPQKSPVRSFRALTVKVLSAMYIPAYIFLAAFYAGSPLSFKDLAFVNGLIAGSEHLTFGHWFRDEADHFSWTGLLAGKELLSYLLITLAALAVIWLKVNKPDKAFAARNGVIILLYCFCGLYLGYLWWRIQAGFPHYLLLILPPVLILASFTVEQLIVLIRKKLFPQFAPETAFVIILALIVIEIPVHFNAMLTYRTTKIKANKEGDIIKTGAWLKSNFDEYTSILHDHYSYIPPEFRFAYPTWGGTLQDIKDLDPDVIIMNREIAKKYSNSRRADLFINGPKLYLQKRAYYHALDQQKIPYKEKVSFGAYHVYRKIRTWDLMEPIDTIIRIINDFEPQTGIENWYNLGTITQMPQSDNHASHTGPGMKYGATYISEIGSLHLLPGQYIRARARVMLDRDIDIYARMVISLQEPGGRIYAYRNVYLSKFLRKSGTWKTVDMIIEVPAGIKEQDILKVYTWSPGEKIVYTDDMEIAILR